MKYNVHVRCDWVYEIEADTPEDAAAEFDYEPPRESDGECTGYSIDAVTATDDRFGSEDLRQPVPCRGGCGKTFPASDLGECLDCMLKRLAAARAAREHAAVVAS